MLSYPDIDPVAVSIDAFTIAGKTIGPLAIHWYGLMYLFGFVGAWFLAHRRARRPDTVIEPKQAEDLIFYGAMGIVIGGRLGYVFFYVFDAWLDDPLMLFRVWEGGMSFHGGLIGTALAMLLFARKVHKNFFDIVDFVAPFAPLGIFFGRIGNFIGGDRHGQGTWVTATVSHPSFEECVKQSLKHIGGGNRLWLPWGMVFPTDPLGVPRHPSQLYEALLEGVVLFTVLFWFSSKPRPRASVIALFLILYGTFRFTVEFFREPDAHIMFDLFGWMTRGQILSLPMIILGLVLIIWTYSQEPRRMAGKQTKP